MKLQTASIEYLLVGVPIFYLGYQTIQNNSKIQIALLRCLDALYLSITFNCMEKLLSGNVL